MPAIQNSRLIHGVVRRPLVEWLISDISWQTQSFQKCSGRCEESSVIKPINAVRSRRHENDEQSKLPTLRMARPRAEWSRSNGEPRVRGCPCKNSAGAEAGALNHRGRSPALPPWNADFAGKTRRTICF